MCTNFLFYDSLYFLYLVHYKLLRPGLTTKSNNFFNNTRYRLGVVCFVVFCYWRRYEIEVKEKKRDKRSLSELTLGG